VRLRLRHHRELLDGLHPIGLDEACLEVFRAHRSAKMPRAFAVQLNARVFAAIDQHVHVSALEQAPGLLRSLGLRQQDTLGGLWVVAVLGANFDQLVKPLAQLLELVASGRIVRVPHLVATMLSTESIAKPPCGTRSSPARR